MSDFNPYNLGEPTGNPYSSKHDEMHPLDEEEHDYEDHPQNCKSCNCLEIIVQALRTERQKLTAQAEIIEILGGALGSLWKDYMKRLRENGNIKIDTLTFLEVKNALALIQEKEEK